MVKSAEILCIGTELLMGDIVNTNAAYLAKELAGIGINLYHQTVVGDNADRLRESLALALSRADVVITTGGLGPTYDDLSKETVAAFFGKKLVCHPQSELAIHALFQRLGRTMTDNNKKQALLPEGCTVFPNLNGTAPGCAIEGDGELLGKTAILLPGPPREMAPMFEEYVRPYLMKDSDTRLVSHSLHFFGIGESALESKLFGQMSTSTNPTIAPYAKTGEVLLRLTARVEAGQDAEAILAPAISRIEAVAGEFIYGVDVGDLQTAAVRALMQKNLKVATAESCTAGYVSKRLTEVSGASAVFECGLCCYSDRIKTELLGVSPKTIGEHGAVSLETAREMAASIRRLSGADVGLSVTGNAGPEPSEGKPVGLVYIGIDSQNLSEVLTLNLSTRDQDARELIRYTAASHALHQILRAALAGRAVPLAGEAIG